MVNFRFLLRSFLGNIACYPDAAIRKNNEESARISYQNRYFTSAYFGMFLIGTWLIASAIKDMEIHWTQKVL